MMAAAAPLPHSLGHCNAKMLPGNKPGSMISEIQFEVSLMKLGNFN